MSMPLKNTAILLIDLVDFSRYEDLPTRRQALDTLQGILIAASHFLYPESDPFKNWLRHGTGDGYYIILKNQLPLDALKYAQKIQTEIESHNKIRGRSLPIRTRMSLTIGDVD